MAMKRANGMGSIYKKRNKNLRKPYYAVITTGYTSGGKAIRKTIGTFAKAKEAHEALAQFTTGVFINADKIKFKDVWTMMVEEKKRVRVSINASFKMAATKLTPHLEYGNSTC